jgi:hypothetical protein
MKALYLSRLTISGTQTQRQLCFSVLLLLAIPTASADTLGRLFFTPAQRQQLDDRNARHATSQDNTASYVTVDGIVQKQGGARTVWVNGVAQSTGNTGDRTPTAQTVTIPGKSRSVKLKVGEKIMFDQPAATAPNISAE